MTRHAFDSLVLVAALAACSRGEVRTFGEPHETTVDAGVEPSGASDLAVKRWVPRGPQIAAGRAHTCAVLEDDRVVCWGANAAGQAGSFDTLEPVAPTVLEGLRAHSITAAEDHTCALGRNGELLCWGSGRAGQLGGGSGASPERLGEAATFVQASAGSHASCGVATSGEVRCWGRPIDPFGRNDPTMHEVPIEGATQVVAGSSSIGCALDGSTGTWCWRWQHSEAPAYGQARLTIPSSVAVGVGEDFACALGEDGLVRCWGSNASRTLSLSAEVTRVSEPRVIPGLDEVERLAVGAATACVRRRDGSVWCFGSNEYGQLGRTGQGPFGAPTRIEGLAVAVELDVGGGHACAMTEAREVFCWGRADEGQLGIGTEDAVAWQPVRVEHVARAVEIASARDEVCAIAKGGGIVCWNVLAEPSVRKISRTENARAMGLVSGGGCALVDGSPRCWGKVDWKDRRVETDDFTAREVDGVPHLTALAGDSRRAICGLDAEGSVWCWGSAVDPESDEPFAYGPTRQPKLHDMVEVALQNDGLGCGRRSDGRSICWALPGSEQQPMVALVVGPRNIVSLAAGADVCASTGVGALWCWGKDVAAFPIASPTGPAIAIAIGDEHGCALLETQQVACWGNSDNGQLGNGRADLLPGIVRGLEGVESITAAGDRTCALKRDGAIFCWGAPDPADRVPYRSSTPRRVPLPA